jgi:hypothetical protein
MLARRLYPASGLIALCAASIGCRGPAAHLTQLPKGFLPEESPPAAVQKDAPAQAVAKPQEVALPAVEKAAPIPRAQSRKPVQEIEPKRPPAVRLVGISPDAAAANEEAPAATRAEPEWSPDVDDWASPSAKTKPAAHSTVGAARKRVVPADRGE